MEHVKSPVHRTAEALNITVKTPTTLRQSSDQAEFASLGAHVAVVVAYGLLLPKAVLDAPRLGCLNGHASKLPRWRGAAPLQRAIMAGDRETAMMIMRMEPGLDTGPVCLSEAIAIGVTTTAGDLHDLMKDRAAALMVEALALLEKGDLRETPQPEDGVTYATKIAKAEAQIDFDQPASRVVAHIHGLSPSPGAWFEATVGAGKPERIKVLRARLSENIGPPGRVLNDALMIACQDGSIEIMQAQRAGKKPMDATELLRGFALSKGSQITRI